MNKILIIIPAYNEEDFISSLLDEIFSLGLGLDVLVVDDSSDKTSKIVKEKQLSRKNLFLIKRNKKSGRGTAVLEGLKFGLQKDYEYFVEIDGDFCHQPKELPGLLALARQDAVVIASRHIKGSVMQNWSFKRRIFSRLANFYADLILGIGIHDYTNGYRVYGRQAIEKLDFEKIKSSGFIVLSEIAYQLFKKGVRFFEQKSLFINRKKDSSNVTFKEIKESLLAVIRIRKEFK